MALRGVRRAVGPLVAAALPLCLAFLPSRAERLRAADATVRFDELLAGANGDSRIQFIEIAVGSLIGACWGPQVAPGTAGADSDDSRCYLGGASETRSRNALVFFDSQGRETGRYKFPENPATAGAPPTPSRPSRGSERRGTAVLRSDSNQNTVLVATEAFAQLPGAPQPHFVIPPLLNAIAGKVCFVGNTAENPNATPFSICVAYGPFVGDTEGAGAPAPALPLVDTVSLQRTSGFENRNSSFSTSNAPSPGGTYRIGVAPRVAQGETLFMQEAFGGNGRTCGGCHPTTDSGRLTPAEIQNRFRTVATTLDNLFISETATSGFDFGLNTLTIAARPVPASGTDFLNGSGGDLRGVITSANGARARVLTRSGPTTYLVYAGMTPRLGGTITDEAGNEAVVVNVARGNLDGLESPRLMRRSVLAQFPQGRALILENIDGFGAAPVFRKSPHMLNLSRTGPFGFSATQTDLKLFTVDAVRQHFPRTLARAHDGPDPDFRLPTADELSALEAFQLSKEFPAGSDPNKFNLDRFVTTPAQQRGRTLFFGVARCSFCHGGPVLATTTVNLLNKGLGVNASFNTGVAAQPINGANVDNLACEPAGACNTREFSIPPLFNISNVAPYFHDNSAATLRDAILFYSSASFALSPAGRVVGPIALAPPQIDDLIAFLDAVSAPANTTDAALPDAAVTDGSTRGATAIRVSQMSARLTAPVTIRTADGLQLTATAIARGLSDPSDIALAPDGRIFVAERSGHVRMVRGGQVLPTPVVAIKDFAPLDGSGTLAIALDPDFTRAPFLYALYTSSKGFQLARYRVTDAAAVDRAILVDNLGPPSSRPGAALRFGPDGALYVAIDDGGEARAAGNLGSRRGKVLRLNADGSTPRDQASGSPVYAVDVARPRAVDWDARGRLWVIEPTGASAFAEDSAGSKRGAMISRVPLLEALRADAIAFLGDDILIGFAATTGLLRVPASQEARPGSEWLFRGVIDGVRAFASTNAGTIYVVTGDAVVRIVTQASAR